MPARRSVLIIAVILAWFVATAVYTGLHHQSETVPIGVDYTLTTPASVFAKVSCNGVFSSSPAEALPPLTPQPTGRPALAYQGTPCGPTQHQLRRVLLLDAVLALLAVVGLVMWTVRSGERRQRSRSMSAAAPS